MPFFTCSSELPVSADQFLATLSMEGVNAELSPLVRMTAPEAFSARGILEWPVKRQLFSSWILLFGFLPIDRHRFFFAAINPDEGFSERSTSWTNKRWCHDRTVVQLESGCRVTDTVKFRSRMPFLDVLLKPTYLLVFRWRHRNLRRRYGGRAS